MERSALSQLGTIVTLFRDRYPEASVTTIHLFLLVAQHDGETTAFFLKHSPYNASALSRHFALLSDRGMRTARPMRLIRQTFPPDNYKERSYHLTAKGKKLVAELEDIMTC